jgi:Late embryogenesis abundant protein
LHSRPQVRLRLASIALALLVLQACAAGLGQLGNLIQPPRFEQIPGRPAEIRLQGTTGATVRLWTRVSNPNAFGFTLGTLNGTLFLEETRAAGADFPLGLPLGARGESDIPIDISISFANLPGLAGVARRVFAQQPVGYRLEGTVGVDAGPLGRPVFGPMTLLTGEAAVPIR